MQKAGEDGSEQLLELQHGGSTGMETQAGETETWLARAPGVAIPWKNSCKQWNDSMQRQQGTF